MNRRFVFVALILSAFVIYTRAKFHAQYLYSWDSVSFALSVEHFDVHLHQPHPPGYILYSYTIRILNDLVQDPNKTMIYLNIAASIGACIALYKLVWMMSQSHIAAAGASFLYAVNPVSAFYGSVAEIYAIEGFWVMVIVLFLMASRKQEKYLIWASVAMAVAGGFRPTTEIFLLPVYLACCFIREKKNFVLPLAVLLIGNLLWFVPLVLKSGGLQSYLEAVRGQSERAAADASEPGESGSAWKLILRILQAISLPVIIAVLIRMNRLRVKRIDWLLATAILPSVVFFFIFPYPKDGYLLVFIPALIAMFALFLSRLYSVGTQAAVLISSCALTWFFYIHPVTPPSFLGEFTQPNRQIMQARMDRLKNFFEIVDGIEGGSPKVFVLETRHFFPNWRTMLYYYPNSPIYLVWPNKRRAYLANNHEYTTIPAPIRIPQKLALIAVGRAKPEIKMDSFQVGSFRYYFAAVSSLPKNFSLYSMRCVVVTKGS
jgi:hypothetical protein